MNAFARLRILVEQALDLPASERDAFLAEECEADGDLLAEARDLLEASADRDFLVEPASFTPPVDPALPEGARIGDYRLLGTIASGGMATVYLAEREEPRRRVALKVMRSGLLSPASVARFRYEVEVLASLRHAHIAPMYETGVEIDEGREVPWFAMEFVEGARAITAFVRDEGLSLRQRVELFADVCDAVQHGHGRGVLHRDLKPDNLLVDDQGVPKVIDFGVAKAIDAEPGPGTLLTAHGEIIGTLAYMSPEQLSGRGESLGTRSDVYSLGVVLFEMLTGRLPYDVAGKSLVETARAIETEVPVRPSSLDPATGGDLETILLQCLEKDPDRRYASAAALADDLRRFLAHRPIEAHPPSVTYQLRMFVRRHRLLVAAACLILVVSVTATAVSLVFLSKARRSEEVALDREARATEEADRARKLFNKLLDRSVSTTFDLAPRLRDLAGGTALNSEVIADAIGDLESLEQEARGDPEIRARIAEALLRLGDAQGNPAFPNLGDRPGALRSYGRAEEIVSSLLATDPESPDLRRLSAVCARKRGEMAMLSGDLDTARREVEVAIATLTRLVEEHPLEVRFLTELGTAHDKMGGVASRSGDQEGCRRHTEAYAGIYRELARRDPGNEGLRAQVAFSHQQLAGVSLREKDFETAIREWTAASNILEELVAKNPHKAAFRMKIAWSEMWAGTAEQRRGRLDAAEERLAKALGIYRVLTAEDPENDQYPIQLANLYWTLGTLADDRSRADGVADDAREAHRAAAVERIESGLEILEGLKEQGRLLPIHARFPAILRQRRDEIEKRRTPPR